MILMLVRLRMSSAANAPNSSHFKCEKIREQLILAVQSYCLWNYPCLWNTSIHSYHITGAKQNAWEEVAKQCGCQGEYIWHGRSMSVWNALTVTWSSAVINGPHDIVVLSFQCKCAWALAKLYGKNIAERNKSLKTKSGMAAVYHRKWSLYDAISFLEPIVQSKKYVLF